LGAGLRPCQKIDRELLVKIAKLIFPVIGRWKVSRKLFQISFVVGAVVIDAFVNTEVLPVFDRLEGMTAVRALEFQRRCNFFTIDEGLSTDFAFELSTTTVVIVDIRMWGTAERTDGICRDITSLAFLGFDRLYGFAIT